MTSAPIHLLMPLIGDGRWPGGINYQRTILQLCAGPLANRVTVTVAVAPELAALAGEAFGGWLARPLLVDPRLAGAGQGRRGLAALATGIDRSFADLTLSSGADVVFETARFFGWRFPRPVLSWMPDFQHRHLPHLFPWSARWRREIGFRAQTLGRRVVLVSSQTAAEDCARFYPRSHGRIAVARFAAQVDLPAIRERAAAVGAAHALPDRFVYLPNQFWAHKNHATVVEALALLAARRPDGLIGIPPVVMTGPTQDHRAPGLYANVMSRAKELSIEPWFRHLGLVPFADVLALNAAAEAVLNPSTFEGWASSVEEAKALGTPLILSDIAVHREQTADARFFPPTDAPTLAALLDDLAAAPPRRVVPDATLVTAQQLRIDDFAGAFLAGCEAARTLGQK
jgi:glycosyltransferase involved in cell wall biosynthesis